MCDDVAKAKAIWKKVEEGPFARMKEGLISNEDVKVLATLNGNILSIKILAKAPNDAGIDLPEELQTGLKDVD